MNHIPKSNLCQKSLKPFITGKYKLLVRSNFNLFSNIKYTVGTIGFTYWLSKYFFIF